MSKRWNAGRMVLGLLGIILTTMPSQARVGLVTIPRRDAVQLTIYNTADITLVREQRALTFAKGINRLEFSWAGTLIDPTSVQFDPVTHAAAVEVIDISFPPSAPNALVWNIQSEVEGEVVVEISYFTAGLTWAADYEGVVKPAGDLMNLKSYVKVTNNSGEVYDAAQVRLVVGTINLVESITELANRGAGRPLSAPVQSLARKSMAPSEHVLSRLSSEERSVESAPEIIREGLSEYFLYTVAGKHEIQDHWSVRWLNFEESRIPVKNFYRYEEGRYNRPQRFVMLRNDKDHMLGKEPLPDGRIEIYQEREGRRVYLGGSVSKYVPVKEEWEIDVGIDPDVIVDPKKKRFAVERAEFDKDGNPVGWDIEEDWELCILNSSRNPITIEIDRNFSGDFTARIPKEDVMYDFNTARFRRELAARSDHTIVYSVTWRQGVRAKR